MSDATNFKSPECTNEVDSEPRLTVLDPEGDVTLVIIRGNEAQRFIKCCSRVLTLASSVFSEKLSAHHLKEVQRPDNTCPMIELKEDHPNAMVQMLCLLHHSEPLDFEAKPKDIAAVAIQSQKYECQKALRAWGESVCRPCIDRGISDPVGIGYLILAAHLFNLPSFEKTVAYGLKNLQPNFQCLWMKDAIMKHLPVPITFWVATRVCSILVDLQTKVYRMEGRIRANRTCWPLFASSSGKKYCRLCGRGQPPLFTYCTRCEHTDSEKACPRQSRSTAYLNNLEIAGLWPSPVTYMKISAVQLLEKIRCLSELPIPHEHECRAGPACTLRLAHDGLYNICKIYLDDQSVPTGGFSCSC